MRDRKIIFFIVYAFVLQLFIACDDSLNLEDPLNNQTVNTEGSEAVVADALVENVADHESPEDYIWDSSDVIQIVINGNTITANGVGLSVEGSKVTISNAGTYLISGALDDGQIIVDSESEETVRLILNGVDIRSSTSAPIYIKNAEKTIIILVENSKNYLSDGVSYTFEDPEMDEPNAAVFSDDDLTIYGNGSLTVDGNYNDGIASKDGLIIASGTLNVNAVDGGIRGKDYLVIKNGNIIVNVDGNGLKSDNDENSAKGYIFIKAGVININSGRDAITGETDVLITNGSITLTSGGGSNTKIDESLSAKGIKAGVCTIIDEGSITINSADDATI